MCVTMFAEHPRVAFQTHAVRILDVVAADNVAAPETLYLKI